MVMHASFNSKNKSGQADSTPVEKCAYLLIKSKEIDYELS